MLKIHGGSTSARPRVGELRRQRGRLHRLSRPGRRCRRCCPSASRRGCAGATCSSSATSSTTGACACSCTALGRGARRLPLVGDRARREPLERELWRQRGVELVRRAARRVRRRRSIERGRRIGGGRDDDAAARRPSPYKGLAPFEDSELDELLFFGREREREVIVANLVAARLTVLYGPSGVGKSSVLRAGVARDLRARRNLADGERSSPSSPRRVARRPGAALAAAAMRASGSGLAAPDRAGSRSPTCCELADRARRRRSTWCSTRSRSTSSTTATTRPGASRRARRARQRARPARPLPARDPRGRARAASTRSRARVPNLLGNCLRLDQLDRDGGARGDRRPVERVQPSSSPARTPVEIEPALVDAVLEQVAAGGVVLGQAGAGRSRPRTAAPDRDAVPPARDAAALGRGAGAGVAGCSGSRRSSGSAAPSGSSRTTSSDALDALDAGRAGAGRAACSTTS